MSWEKGFTLESASRRYGPPDVVQRYNRLETTHPTIDSLATLVSKTIEAFDTPKGKPSPFKSAEMRDLTQVASKKGKLLQALQEALVHRLKTGKLVGYGFETPRQASSEPVKIPSDVWFGSIKWGVSSVKGNGLEFIQVRVSEVAVKELPTKSVKKGRPSRSDHITEAFWTLDAEGKIPNPVENIKALFEPVLRQIDVLHPNLAGTRRGLGEKTLYEKISTLLDERSKQFQ